MTIIVKKRNGEDVELESEEPLTIAEICELLGENQSNGIPEMQETLVKLVESLKSQPAPQVNVAAPAVTVNTPPAPLAEPSSPSTPPRDWKRAKVRISKWDNIGRIQEMEIEKS